MKYLDAVVAGVGDSQQATLLRRKRNRARAVELSGGGAKLSKRPAEGAVRIEHLDAVVAGVGDGYYAVAAYCNALRRYELAAAGATRSQVKGMDAPGMVHSNPVVASVSNDHSAHPQDMRCGIASATGGASRHPRIANRGGGGLHASVVDAHRRDGARGQRCGGNQQQPRGMTGHRRTTLALLFSHLWPVHECGNVGNDALACDGSKNHRAGKPPSPTRRRRNARRSGRRGQNSAFSNICDILG